MILPEKLVYEQPLYGGVTPTHIVENPIHTPSEYYLIHFKMVV